MIARKPVPVRSNVVAEKPPVKGVPESGATKLGEKQPSDQPPAYDQLATEPIEEGEPQPDLDEQLEHLHLETEHLPHGPIHVDEEDDASPQPSHGPEKASKWKAALGVAVNEAKHFAGGLITHPYEATKHFAILRHSHGFVFYQGPATSVAITIFASQPLPADRTLWLQKRGFSGNAGLKLGASALGSRSAWIDVTPALPARAEQLPPADERAWQRDIARFAKKARGSKHIAAQLPRETDVVRIPHVAEDGYFRIVLCAGRKVLCPSPVFRYASASTDPGRLRGASLKTMPLELGIKLGAFVANQMGSGAASSALSPVTTSVQNAVQPYELGGLTQAAAQQVYTATGAEDKVNAKLDEANEQYESQAGLDGEMIRGESALPDGIEKYDEPRSPYPVRFAGRVVRGSGQQSKKPGVPTASLSGVPEDTLLRLSGVYIAWVMIQKPKDSSLCTLSPTAYDVWHQAIVTAAASHDARASVVEKRCIHTHLICDFDGRAFFDAKVNVMLMAFLRPTGSPTTEKQPAQCADDVAIVREVLSQPAWAAESVLERTKSQASARSFPERLANVRSVGQKQVDRLQLHRFGVRMDSMQTRDQMVGIGGICVQR